MKIGRYQTSTNQQRLSGEMIQRGSQIGISTAGAFVFGSPFILIGTTAVLFGTKIINVPVNAPSLLLIVFGSVFALAGMTLWGMAWKQASANRHRRNAARQHPEERAWQDYPWNPRGYTPRRWAPIFKGWAAIGSMALFLSMFNWWAFGKEGNAFLKLIVGLFDLILIYATWQGIIKTGRALKFGGSEIQFTSFPYRLSQPLVLNWRPATRINRANQGYFTLRCAKEWWEDTGSGKNRSRQLIQEQLWSGTWHLEEARTFQPNEQVELAFEPPTSLPPTRLGEGSTVFWELEVKLDLPGLDFEERYLVPVYEKSPVPAIA